MILFDRITKLKKCSGPYSTYELTNDEFVELEDWILADLDANKEPPKYNRYCELSEEQKTIPGLIGMYDEVLLVKRPKEEPCQ